MGQVNILLELLTVFSLAIVYPEEGSIAETSVKILKITGQFYNFEIYISYYVAQVFQSLFTQVNILLKITD